MHSNRVMTLTAKPAARIRSLVMALATQQHRLAFGDRERTWLPSGGTRDSTLDLKAVEKLHGATKMRTQSTIDALAANYFAGPREA